MSAEVICISTGQGRSLGPTAYPAQADLSDALCCACVLEVLADRHVTWITSPAAASVLDSHPLIDRLIAAESPADLPADLATATTVLSLTDRPDWIAFANTIDADRHYGYGDDPNAPNRFHPTSHQLLLADPTPAPLQRYIYALIDRPWSGQRYTLGYQSGVTGLWDIGLHAEGPFTQNRANWPTDRWSALAERLGTRYAVSIAPSRSDARRFVDWISGCSLIVSAENPGLTLAIASRLPVVGLFQARWQRTYLYGRGLKVTPLCADYRNDCQPDHCRMSRACIDAIDIDAVARAVDQLMALPPSSELSRITPAEPMLAGVPSR